MCLQLDSLKQALRQLADDKDASLAAALAPLQEKLAKQQEELDATTAALKAAQAVRSFISGISGSQHLCLVTLR